jgi:hypothetical protein
MPVRKLYFSLCFALLVQAAWAGSKPQAPAPKNPEWVLALTALDVSGLDQPQQGAGDLINRNMVRFLAPVRTRHRGAEEYAYYEGYARAKARTEAAKNLEARRAERDRLAYQGYPEWKYQKSLREIEAKIADLEAECARVEAEIPPVEPLPLVKLSGEPGQALPDAPRPGAEYQFCVRNNADGFLAAAASSFQGRTLLRLRLYTRSGGWEYEDSVIFSVEDTQAALNEAGARFAAAVSGARPGGLAVRAEPAGALVVVDHAFGGVGGMAASEYPPGEYVVEGYAERYEPFRTALEINAGELAELFINLKPLALEGLTIDAPETGSLYQGALYAGEPPISLEVPAGRIEYFYLETEDGQARTVVAGGAAGLVEMEIKPLVSPQEQRVLEARRAFYRAFGRFWIALPVAVVFGAAAQAELNAYNRLTAGNQGLYESATRNYYISIGLWIAFGLTAAESVYRAFRYAEAGNAKGPQIIYTR